MGLVPESEILDDTGRTTATIDEYRLSASGEIRAALSVFYVVPADSADIADAETRALIERHGIALALAGLTSIDSGQTQSTRTNANAAKEWLASVRMGNEKLELPRRAADEEGVPRLLVGIGRSGGGAPVLSSW
jgi:hypothetical protein